MEYLKRVMKVLRESYWASVGGSFKFSIEALVIVALVGGLTYGLDYLVKMLIKF